MRRQLPVMLIVTVLTGLVAIACLVQVFELKGQVQNLQRTLSDQQMQLQESVSSQYGAVKNLLEEEAEPARLQPFFLWYSGHAGHDGGVLLYGSRQRNLRLARPPLPW